MGLPADRHGNRHWSAPRLLLLARPEHQLLGVVRRRLLTPSSDRSSRSWRKLPGCDCGHRRGGRDRRGVDHRGRRLDSALAQGVQQFTPARAVGQPHLDFNPAITEPEPKSDPESDTELAFEADSASLPLHRNHQRQRLRQRRGTDGGGCIVQLAGDATQRI